MAVYFIQDAAGPIKIGKATNPLDRLRDMQVGNPRKLVLLASAPGGVAEERMLHRRFRNASIGGEWFEPIAELIALVKDVQADPNAPLPVNVNTSTSRTFRGRREGVSREILVPIAFVDEVSRRESDAERRREADWKKRTRDLRKVQIEAERALRLRKIEEQADVQLVAAKAITTEATSEPNLIHPDTIERYRNRPPFPWVRVKRYPAP